MNIENAIILEGGALRGVYTSGVLDVLMENDMYFFYTIGVSAGALNGVNYISRQPQRGAKVNLDFVGDSRYMGVKPLVKKHMVFNFDFLFGEIANDLVPFDRFTFNANPQRFVVTTTNCRTGQAEYFEKGKCSNIFDACAASASMPLLSRPVVIDGDEHLDGGIAESVPFHRAMEDGYGHPVLVLTRQRGYRKPPLALPVVTFYRKKFGKYPEFCEQLVTRQERYNNCMDEIDRLEDAGEIFVLRPQTPVTVGRVEKNVEKLRSLYYQGKSETAQRLDELRSFLDL